MPWRDISDRARGRSECAESHPPFSRLREHDVTGNLLQHLLKHCAPPCTPNPSVLWRCAVSAGFLWEAVREVLPKACGWLRGGAQMESPEGTDPELAQLRAWKVCAVPDCAV